MMICIGLCLGKISEVKEKGNEFFIKFESEEGYNDLLSFEKDSRQLQDLAEILEKPFSLTEWPETRLRLFLGPQLDAAKGVMVYGISNLDTDKFVVPDYIFRIINYTPKKNFYTSSEVAEILEYTEDQL